MSDESQSKREFRIGLAIMSVIFLVFLVVVGGVYLMVRPYVSVYKLFRPSADKDVTADPRYNFSSFAGTIWKTKTKTAITEGKRYTGAPEVNLLPPERFDQTHPNYSGRPDLKIIAVLPPGTRLRIARLLQDQGASGAVQVEAVVLDGTNAQKAVFLHGYMLTNVWFAARGPTSNTNWGGDPEFLERQTLRRQVSDESQSKREFRIGLAIMSIVFLVFLVCVGVVVYTVGPVVKHFVVGSPDKDVTADPSYNFSSFAGTVWKTKTNTAIVDLIASSSHAHPLSLVPPDCFDPTHSNYTVIRDMKIIALLPPGNRLRITRAMKDQGNWGGVHVEAILLDGTNAQKVVYLENYFLARNTNWGVDPDMLEKANNP